MIKEGSRVELTVAINPGELPGIEERIPAGTQGTVTAVFGVVPSCMYKVRLDLGAGVLLVEHKEVRECE